MTTPTEIRAIADLRMEEAELLFLHQKYDGAFYLAGYKLELYLKAKICECLNLDDFYSIHAPKSELSKTFLVHNFNRLFLLSGVHQQFEQEKTTQKHLTSAWSCISEAAWSESIRYDSSGKRDDCTVRDFMNAINTISQWILEH